VDERVGQLGEKRLLEEIILPRVNPNMDPYLAGDDCGLLHVADGSVICVSTDRVPWDLTAYRLELMSEFDLGHYLAVLNISDIAAMGAVPVALLLNVAIPANFPVNKLKDIIDGALAAAAENKCVIIGGDLSDSAEPSLCATSIGVARQNETLPRFGAQPGDAIYMTSPFGVSATGFRYFRDARPSGMRLADDEEAILRSALIRPTPQVRAGQELARHGLRITAMDNTDGLSQSLADLAAINSRHYSIEASQLRVGKLTVKVADFLGEEPVELGMGPGADMNLVGTVNDASLIETMGMLRIGTVEEGTGVSIVTKAGRSLLQSTGWNYFLEKARWP
jgi:thiamine-monophosphate kinase